MIYLLEDDNSIRELVGYTLNAQGLETEGFDRPSAFDRAMKEHPAELVILDIMLPEESGLDVLRRLRETYGQDVAVLMLTAKATEYDRVIGLDLGADDYLVKPFGMMELVARVNALLRRMKKEEPEGIVSFREVTVDPVRRLVTVDDEEVTLTYKEFELLYRMMSHPEAVYSREQLLKQIWGYDYVGETRTVDVHIRTLRQKLGEAARYIQTVHGVGYKLGE